MRKAYENHHFLNSEAARGLRLLSEYLEPKTRLARWKVGRAIVFFGSARTRPLPVRKGRGACTNEASPPDYYLLAAALSEKLARWTMQTHRSGRRYHFCSGGGPGIMQAVHEGAARVNRGLNIGLNISLPHEQFVNAYLPRKLAFEFHYFFMRKFWFMNLARGVVVFPGGYGTFDELFEMLTLTQTGKSERMPIVLFGREFWQTVVNFEELVRRGYVAADDLAMFTLTDSVDEAFDLLTRALPE